MSLFVGPRHDAGYGLSRWGCRCDRSPTKNCNRLPGLQRRALGMARSRSRRRSSCVLTRRLPAMIFFTQRGITAWTAGTTKQKPPCRVYCSTRECDHKFTLKYGSCALASDSPVGELSVTFYSGELALSKFLIRRQSSWKVTRAWDVFQGMARKVLDPLHRDRKMGERVSHRP